MAVLRRIAVLALLAGGGLSAAAQSGDPTLDAQLRSLFPAAVAFSPREGNPPHFTAYATSAPQQRIAGYAFWTTELVPSERGYDGPIKILVGMDTAGLLTGIIVAAHHEPYGFRSIDRPAFPAQFKGKNIHDGFRVGADIDWVSRATISVTSASRAIRDSARRVADALLPPAQD
jgi:NosR/NirI family transcriptional regulator, nitrous oxide reductase regulator